MHPRKFIALKSTAMPGRVIRGRLLRLWMRLAAGTSFFLLAGMVVVLTGESVRFFRTESISPAGFVFGGLWHPESGRYGAGLFFLASLRISGLATLFSLPGSLVLGLFLSDYAPAESRRRYSLILDTLSSVPAVIYGLFALMFVTPVLHQMFGIHLVQPDTIVSASLMLGVFITPYGTRLVTESLTRNRSDLRTAAMALGATRFETISRLVLPEALPGLASALLLVFSRALGESVIVGMASGYGPRLTTNLLGGGESVTGYLLKFGANAGEVVFAFGSILFAVTLGLNVLGDHLAHGRFVEELR